MKTTNTLPPVMPVKRPKDYNDWHKHLQKQLNKTTGLHPIDRLKGLVT